MTRQILAMMAEGAATGDIGWIVECIKSIFHQRRTMIRVRESSLFFSGTLIKLIKGSGVGNVSGPEQQKVGPEQQGRYGPHLYSNYDKTTFWRGVNGVCESTGNSQAHFLLVSK